MDGFTTHGNTAVMGRNFAGITAGTVRMFVSADDNLTIHPDWKRRSPNRVDVRVKRIVLRVKSGDDDVQLL